MIRSKLSIPLSHILVGELGIMLYHISNVKAMVLMKHLELYHIQM